MRKAILIVIIVILLVSVSFIAITTEKDLREYSYCAYGDSITNGHATGTNYLLTMKEKYDLMGEIRFYKDGNVKNTSWAVDSFASHFKFIRDEATIIGYNFIVFEAFGFADGHNSIDPFVTAYNKLSMFNMSKEMEIKNYFICIPVFGNSSYEKAKEYIDVMENLFLRFNVLFVPLYDSVDIVPFNNQFDGFDNSSFFIDGIHPNDLGYQNMATYLWTWLNENKDKIQ